MTGRKGPRTWTGSWTGSPDNPSAASAINAMSGAISAASACAARQHASRNAPLVVGRLPTLGCALGLARAGAPRSCQSPLGKTNGGRLWSLGRSEPRWPWPTRGVKSSLTCCVSPLSSVPPCPVYAIGLHKTGPVPLVAASSQWASSAGSLWGYGLTDRKSVV